MHSFKLHRTSSPPRPARRMSFLTAHGPAGAGAGRVEVAEAEEEPPPPRQQQQEEEVRFLRSHSRRSYSEDVHPWLDPQPVALPRTWGLAPAGRSKTLHFVRHGEGHHVRPSPWGGGRGGLTDTD